MFLFDLGGVVSVISIGRGQLFCSVKSLCSDTHQISAGATFLGILYLFLFDLGGVVSVISIGRGQLFCSVKSLCSDTHQISAGATCSGPYSQGLALPTALFALRTEGHHLTNSSKDSSIPIRFALHCESTLKKNWPDVPFNGA